MSLHTGIALFSIAAILHSIGFYFLKRFKADSICSSSQRLCLLNLCFVEFLLSVNGIIIRMIIVITSPQLPLELVFTIECIQIGFVNPWYISVMILLTFDRLLIVYLNIRYHLYVSTKKTALALSAALIMSGIVVTITMLAQKSWLERFHVLLAFVSPTYDLVFILVALLAYGYLYVQVQRNNAKRKKLLEGLSSNSNSSATESAEATKEANSSWKRIKRGFYLPTIFVLSFLCFWAIPDLVYTYYNWKKVPTPHNVKSVLTAMYPIGIIFDAVLYLIFPNQKLQTFIKRLFGCCISKCSNGNNIAHSKN